MDEAGGADWESDVRRRLQLVKQLVVPGSVNILLVLYPAVFDYVTELGVGVDLTLAGHTHGGQLSLDWLHRDLNLGLVVTQYTSLLNSPELRFVGEDVRSGIDEGQSRRGHELGAGQFGVKT